MIQWKRRNSIAALIREIELGRTPSLDRHPARLIFGEHLQRADTTKCAICGITLIGRQQHFCSGHWDYAIVDVPLDQQYAQVLASLSEWLRAHLRNPQVTRQNHHWLGVAKGAFTCEVCEQPSGFHEILRTDSHPSLKRHTVCEDHMSSWSPLCRPLT